MAAWATATLPLKQLPSLPAVVSKTSAATCGHWICYLRLFSLPTRGICIPLIAQETLKVTVVVVNSGKTSLQSHVGVWEDPDDGSGSEYDDEEQGTDENDLDFESDWEEEKDLSVATFEEKQIALQYEDELAKEVEQLLEPKERAILQQNAAPNLEKISIAKWCPLHTVALSGQMHFLDQLLENGISIDFPDKDGLTALHISVIGNKDAVVSHLLRKGANPHVKDKDGVSPLHYAVQVGAMQIVKLLIKYNADVNHSDNEGWTPLHVAMQTRNRNIAKVLLINGADKTRKNKDGNTPLDLGLAYGKHFKSYDLTKLLKIVPANRNL